MKLMLTPTLPNKRRLLVRSPGRLGGLGYQLVLLSSLNTKDAKHDKCEDECSTSPLPLSILGNALYIVRAPVRHVKRSVEAELSHRAPRLRRGNLSTNSPSARKTVNTNEINCALTRNSIYENFLSAKIQTPPRSGLWLQHFTYLTTILSQLAYILEQAYPCEGMTQKFCATAAFDVV